MMMTNGIGAVLGSSVSGIVIDQFFTYGDNGKDWHGIWISFALYALVVAILFIILFKHKHNPQLIESRL
jgi:NHS family xanthosine MFS transporter